MLKQFWKYVIEKNWKYTLNPEMLNSQIFCYGKSGSGKTGKVAIPVLEHAIRNRQSAIVYAANIAEYETIRKMAEENDYGIHMWEAADMVIGKHPEVDEVFHAISQGPTLLLVTNRHFSELCQCTVLDELLYRLCMEIPHSPIYRPHCPTRIVLDGLCGNMLIPSGTLATPHLQFCITISRMCGYALLGRSRFRHCLLAGRKI